MRVALAQFDIYWEQPKLNMAWVETHSDIKADLIILPEMFLTGFTMKPANIAETMDSANVKKLQILANKSGKAILGSLALKEDDKVYNRMMFFTPNAEIQYYDKRHLFSYGGEDREFSAGTNDGIFHLKEWKICGRICYDLRFPVWSRNSNQYDLLIYVANWPAPRHHAWLNLVQARAIENQCYAIGVNRIGKDANNLNYLGGSLVVDYNGDVIAESGSSNEIKVTDLSKEKMLSYRERLPFLKDQDQFEIND